MLILRYLFEQLSKILASRDKRLDFLPFTSPESIFIIIGLYLSFVLKWGPWLMEHRKPFKIDRYLLFYNGFQVFCNSGILFYTIYSIVAENYKVNFMCEPLDLSDSFVGMRSAQLTYSYMLVKHLDLFDTIFFVLRKKAQQISFLHVYHHVAILFGAWLGVQYIPGGHVWIFGLLNLFVHIIMYSYYFGTVYYPKLKSNQLIKKSITQMQIIQFVLSICHLSIPLFHDDCNFPKTLLVVAISQNLIMLVLFSDFYHSAYIKPNRIKAKAN